MPAHLEKDLASIKQKVLKMGALVERVLQMATRALVGRSEDDARTARDADLEIDRLQLEIDEDCLKVLALHQPVAADLRFVTATMKITNDLERIGDLAGNLAERAMFAMQQPVLDEPLHFEEMTERTRGMLHDALDAFVSGNAELARSILDRDDMIDRLNREHFDALQERMKRDPGAVETAVTLLSASRNIERIADLATNIAEDVVFLVEAHDIRHPRITR